MKKQITPELWQYCLQYGNRQQAEILQKIIAQNQLLANGHMQTAIEQANFMGFLARAINASSYLEIGIFTGYSLINMAIYLHKNSIITALELEQKHIDIVKNNIDLANTIHQDNKYEPQILNKIEYICGDANISLPKLVAANRKYDLIFIDANKISYIEYYQYAKQLLSENGILLIDNTFKGYNDNISIDSGDQSLNKLSQHNIKAPKFVAKVHEMNLIIQNDPEVNSCMLPIADGLTLVQHRK